MIYGDTNNFIWLSFANIALSVAFYSINKLFLDNYVFIFYKSSLKAYNIIFNHFSTLIAKDPNYKSW